MSRYLRKKFPGAYKLYQEILGEIYYEFFGLGALARNISEKRLRSLEENGLSPLEITGTFRGVGPYRSIRAEQKVSEIQTLFEIVRELEPRTVCEIGTDRGGTLYLWSRAMRQEGMAISLDLPRMYRKALNRFFMRFFDTQGLCFFLRQDSHLLQTRGRVETLLHGRGIDFLFIDGDHSYEGVKKDFELYSPLVNSPGIIAFHDILDNCGVDRFWDEIKTSFRSRELIEDPGQNCAGIGVLFLE